MKKTILFAIIILCISSKILGQSVWTIGPMFHYNFGGEKRHFSFAIETAYWNIKNFPYSIDGGIEFGKKRVRLYSELQTGFGIAGISAGPVLEINKAERKAHLGIQSTVWMNYFIGLDIDTEELIKPIFTA